MNNHFYLARSHFEKEIYIFTLVAQIKKISIIYEEYSIQFYFLEVMSAEVERKKERDINKEGIQH